MLTFPAVALNVKLLLGWSLEKVRDVLRSKRRVLYAPPPSSSLSGQVMPRMSALVST